jgi:hypothetical protein
LHHQYDAKKGVNLTKFSKLVVRSTFSIFVPGYYTALSVPFIAPMWMVYTMIGKFISLFRVGCCL